MALHLLLRETGLLRACDVPHTDSSYTLGGGCEILGACYAVYLVLTKCLE